MLPRCHSDNGAFLGPASSQTGQCHEPIVVKRFLLDQRLDQSVHDIPSRSQQGNSLIKGLFRQRTDAFVNGLACTFGITRTLTEPIPAQEHLSPGPSSATGPSDENPNRVTISRASCATICRSPLAP